MPRLDNALPWAIDIYQIGHKIPAKYKNGEKLTNPQEGRTMPKADASHKPNYEEITIEDVRTNLGDLANRVGYGGERLVITRHGKPVAALVSIADLEQLPAVAA